MRARWFLLAVLLVALDVYLLAWRWADVGGNVEAEAIIITPAFLIKHVADRRERRRHQAELHCRLDEVHQRLDAQDAALNIPPSNPAA